MRLNELLKCVPVDAAQFKNYKRRGQLPFRNREQFSVAPGEKLHSRWTDYTIEDALRLQVMVNLSDYRFPEKAREPETSRRYDGLPPMAASVMATNGVGNARSKYDGLAGLLTQPNDIWHVTITNAWPHEGDVWYGSEHFAGELTECAAKIEEKKEYQVRAILINVSQALRNVLEAGMRAGIEDALRFGDESNA